MDVTASALKKDVTGIIANGTKVRFKYYNISGASTGYDDEVSLSKSGTDYWTSGLVQPLDITRGSRDAVLVEQGKLLNDDKKVYVLGTVPTSGTLKIGIGSPVTQEYSIAPPGVNTWELTNNEPVYKMIYVRYLTNGSLTGE